KDASSTPTIPVFNLTTTGAGNIATNPFHNNVLRHGDVLTIDYGIVRSSGFDTEAHPEVREETAAAPNPPPPAPGSGYDVIYINPENNQISFNFDDTCNVNPPLAGVPVTANQFLPVAPEDLDVDINSTDPELFYVLGNPFAFLDLTVELNNNGGRPATDYQLIVTVGEGLNVTGLPAGCSANGTVGSPGPLVVKGILTPPVVLNSASIYLCSQNDPKNAEPDSDNFTFRVQKASGADLTFRADAVGEVSLFDGTLTGNNYSFDSILARIIGFDLKKTLKSCTEQPLFPISPLTRSANVQIGEDCTYKIDVAWFGFATPGFGQIEIGQFDITDTIPSWQGFISTQTASGGGGSGQLTPETLTTVPPAVTPPNAVSSVNWRYNYDNTTGQIDAPITADVTLSFELTTRMLNDPANIRNGTKQDTAVASFEVDFDGQAGPMPPRVFDDTSGNYPPLSDRQVTTTIFEPNLVVTKRVCNETLLGTPCNPGNPADPTDFGDFTITTIGDADDLYIYMIRLYNDNTLPAIAVAPAFDIIAVDILDAMASATLADLGVDGMDNNRDGVVDDAAETGIGSYVPVPAPPQITFDPVAVPLLAQIDPGQAIDLFYTVDVNDIVVPGQVIANTVNTGYDSLLGASGSQNIPLRPNNDPAGARTYAALPSSASILIANVVAPPGAKSFTNKANLLDVPFVPPMPYLLADAAIGEEVEVELLVELPVSTLKSLTIQDVLPAGLTCIEAGQMVLPNQTQVAPGDLYFTPGGSYPATGCDAITNTPVWTSTPDQLLVVPSPPLNRTFSLRVSFIARVDNIPALIAGSTVVNGGTATLVNVTFLDELNNTVSVPISSASVNVKEPNIQLTVRTGTPNATPPPYVSAITSADSADIYTVEVVIDNNGPVPANLSPAYNLQIVADLTSTPGATYVPGSLGGPNAADFTFDVINSGPNRIVLNYNNPKFDPAPAATSSATLTFQVLLPDNMQPHDILQTSVTANYSSLASNAVALNSSGLIGADNDPDGMRLYSVSQIDTTASVPGLVTSKVESAMLLPLPSDPVNTIGARKRFELQINFPEGLIQSNAVSPLSVVDNLAAAGSTTSYVFENNAAYAIVYEFSGIQSINGITDPAQFPSQITAPLDGAANSVTWTINGDVLTDTEDDLDAVADVINPYIRITYYARIDDNPQTVAGGILLNSALTNYIDRAAGPRVTPPATAGPFTIVEPDLRMNKTANMAINYGIPETYTLDIRNDGLSTAWNASILDVFIEPAMGGVCDTPPANIQAIITDAGGGLQRTLLPNTDFTAVFAPDPVCTLTFTMLTPAASIESTWHLVINYDVTLDLNNANGTTLDNIAGATQYYSLDQLPQNTRARTYTNTLSPTYDLANSTTPFEDFEDAYRITVGAPQLDIVQSVIDFASVPGVLAAPILDPRAQPANTVRYQVHIVNDGPVAITDFDVTEDLDLLNPASGYYQPGTLTILYIPGGATDFSNNVGGTKATGFIDIRNLNIAAANAGNTDELFIQYDITLGPVITSGTRVFNQAQANITDFTDQPVLSDDPDPLFPGDSDPTLLTISSIPSFKLEKTSQDISGDVNVLQAGDILRYTITAQNIGAEDSVNSALRDQIPANTRYVAGTTTLNGTAIADPSNGVSPLQDGMLINAPENLTAGFMRADMTAPPAATNIATVTFDVQLDANVVNGTVISNQAMVGGAGAGSAPFAEQPSDDPGTEIIGDPTRDVVGNVAVLDAQKTVELYIDNGNADEVDIGDTLRYTIVINNSGTVDATDVVLTDVLPTSTSYVMGSTTMNGLPVPDGVGGAFPLLSGLPVSSTDLTPPLPAANMGTISQMQAATLVFDVTVNPLTVDGTIISNQGLVTSADFPDEPTDVDGNETNGDQPTDIIVGSTVQLSISKNVFVVGGGTAQPGAVLEYFIHVQNTGFSAIDLSDLTQVIRVVDDIDQSGLITYVPGSARLNGVSDPNITYTSPRLYVDYGSLKRASPNPLFNPGEKFTVRYLAIIDSGALQGTNISDTAAIDWGNQSFMPVANATPINCNGATQNVNACATIDLAVGGAPGVATLSGSLWHDINFDEIQDSAETVLAGWQVDIYFGAGTVNPGDLLDSVITDANGNYTMLGLIPNDAGPLQYALQFRPPLASTDTASLGQVSIDAGTIATPGPSSLSGLIVGRASHSANINLPIQPNGVIFNSILRNSVSGAVLRMTNPAGVALPVSCFNDPAQQNQRTLSSGFYKFDLNFSQAGICDSGMDFTVNVFPPPGYIDYDNDPSTPVVSLIIPPAAPLTAPGFDAINCSADAIAGTAECEVQASEFAPTIDVPPRTAATDFYQKFTFGNGPADEQIYNNHIAVDPSFNNAIAISKTSPLVNVTRGQLVPYDITLTNTLDAPFYDLTVEDLFPAGFKYIANSGRIQFASGAFIKTEPVHPPGTLSLNWVDIGKLDSKSTLKLKLLLVVGSGVGEGEYVNRAQARNTITGVLESGLASSTVRVVPDPTFDCSDVIGKVFDDKNLNAYQDEGEEGLAGVRVLTARGLEITTDAHGRFHVTCAVVPNPDRGSNFILKLDERSLPSGYRLTTENPRVVRATRGKMVKFSFGAAIHRVVRLDMADAVFEPGTTKMRPQWLPRLDLLITELAKDPSLLRLSYLGENETASEVDDRLDAVKDEIETRWEDLNCCYQLMIETEVFWRKGGPPDRGEFDD
ncbi:Conserved repeat domain protein, partial [hydrothermal vent metagenome]